MDDINEIELLQCVQLSEDHDSSERDFTKQISYVLDTGKQEVDSAYSKAKMSLHAWIKGLRTNTAPLQAHVYYVNYSLVMHLGAASVEYSTLLDIRGKDKHPFNSVNRKFFSCATQCFAALDLTGHLYYLKLPSTDLNNVIDQRTWDFRRNRGYKSLSQLKGEHRRFTVCGEIYDIESLKELFRNKPVHRLFNYVVRRRKGLVNGEVLGAEPALAVVRPDMTSKEICAVRTTVIREKLKRTLHRPYNTWDILPNGCFICSNNPDYAGVIPANELLRSLIVHAWSTYLRVTTGIL